MSTEFILDLGEDGSIVLVSFEENDDIEQVGYGQGARRILVNAKEEIGNRLRALGRLFASTIPPLDSENFELNEFTIEFDLGIAAEVSGEWEQEMGLPSVAQTNVKAVAKLVPQGNFKCSYTWNRKKQPDNNTQGN